MPDQVWLDLHRLEEDKRITLIGEAVMSLPCGKIVGALVDTEPNDEKALRYIRKVVTQFPKVRAVDFGPGPTAGSTLIRFILKEPPCPSDPASPTSPSSGSPAQR